jgi:hypothetical protein
MTVSGRYDKLGITARSGQQYAFLEAVIREI